MPGLTIKDPYISRLYKVFEWYFKPTGETSGDFDYSIRVTVWMNFSNVFTCEDQKKLLTTFRRMFHPDVGIPSLTTAEKTAVFKTFYPLLNSK